MKLGTDALKGIPAAGILAGLAGLAIAGALYWNSFEARRHYLQQRNFRQMALLARQVDRVLETQAHLLTAKLQATAVQSWWSARADQAPLRASVRLPALDVTWSLPVRQRDAAALRAVLSQPAGYRLEVEAPAIDLVWGEAPNRVRARFDAAHFTQILDSRLTQRAFDTLALATPSGRVLVATGPRREAIAAMSLDGLLGHTAQGGAFAQAARSVSMLPVRLAERDYLLFVQPCCRGEGARTPADAALVLVGLVDAAALQSASLAISPLLVLGGVVAVLAALVSWAFLKISLTHAQQAISPLDVLQLGTSSVFGVALVTILVLGTASYVRMRADIDGQLRDLGSRLNDGMSREIRAAYRQSLLAMPALRAAPCRGSTAAADCPVAILPDQSAERAGEPYPDFASIALINGQGLQRRKYFTAASTALHIDVADREYFRLASTGAVWPMDECLPEDDRAGDLRPGCVVEPVWSWGSGAPQAVLAHRTGLAELPVAAIAFPMASVIDPLLPVGFEFAVVNRRGDVLFHSDTQRMGEENLVLETDQNPRIRALMSAQGAGEVNTTYLGRDYRAHVRPAPIPGASIVTLFDKQHTRALALEWMAASLFLLSGYVGVWIATMAVVLWSGTAWIWPDPFRQLRYRVLSAVFAGMLLAFLLVWVRDSAQWTLTAGLALPLAAWIAAVLVLARRPAGVRGSQGSSTLALDYRVMAALLLTVTAVIPGVTFATYSFNVHMESFVKHREIALARDSRRAAPPAVEGTTNLGRYGDVFYDSRVSVDGADGLPPPAWQPATESVVHLLLEDVLPYYTAFSVEMRELIHASSRNDAWRSLPPADGRLIVSVREGAATPRITVEAGLPALLSVRDATSDGAVVPGSVAALLMFLPLGGAIWWAVGFMQRRIFLTDVIDRLWIKGRLVTSAGQHLLVVCRDPAAVVAKFQHAERALLTPLARETDPLSSVALATLRRKALPTQALVVADLDDDADDEALWRRKVGVLAWLMAQSDWTLVVVTRRTRDDLKARIDRLGEDAEWSRRLAGLNVVTLPEEVEASEDTLAITIAAPADDSGRSTASLRRLLKRLVHLPLGRVWAPGSQQWRQALLLAEGRPTQALRAICQRIAASEDVRSGLLTAEQILDEVGESARPVYQAVWQEATEDERVVLEHVARFGLANDASRTTVRKLLARGLLRKDPELRLMNRTFRRFVLGPDCRREVARLEGQADPSLWDRLRLPLATGATVAIAFLVTTQREMFDATLTVAAGMTTAVPTLIQMTNLFAKWGGPARDVRA